MNIIEKKNFTFAQLISEVDKLYPDGKVENFILRDCRINEMPNIDYIIWNSITLLKEISFRIPFINYKIVFRDGIYDQTLFGKFKNPEKIILMRNVFIAVGWENKKI